MRGERGISGEVRGTFWRRVCAKTVGEEEGQGSALTPGLGRADTQLGCFRSCREPGWRVSAGSRFSRVSCIPQWDLAHRPGTTQTQLNLVRGSHRVFHSVFMCKGGVQAGLLRSLRTEVLVGFRSFQVSTPLLSIKIDQRVLLQEDPCGFLASLCSRDTLAPGWK